MKKTFLMKAGIVTALISSSMAMTAFAGTWKWVERGVETGWQYLNDDGTKASGWILDDGKYYYIGDKGYMLSDTTTPDGFKVDKDGVWIETTYDTSLKATGYISLKWDTLADAGDNYTISGTTCHPVIFTQAIVSDIINNDQYKDEKGNVYQLKRTSKLLGLEKGGITYYLEKTTYGGKDYHAHTEDNLEDLWTDPDSTEDITYTIDKNAMIVVPAIKKDAAKDGSTEAVDLPSETISIADFIAKRTVNPDLYKDMDYGKYKANEGLLNELKVL